MNERLKNLRQTLHLSQLDFGKAIGFQRSVISEMEIGTAPIVERTIILICAKFNVNEEWFRNGKGDMFKMVNVKYDEFFKIYNKLNEPLQHYLLISAKELLKTQTQLNL